MRKYISIMILTLLLLTACSQDKQYIYATTLTDSTQSSLHMLEDLFLHHDQIDDVLAVETEKEVLIAYKVKHLQRFQMKKIEKKLKKELKQYIADKKLIISDDFKIHLELSRLMSELEKNDNTTKEVNKKLKKIIKLKKEVT